MFASPLNDLILIRRRRPEESKSGLIIKPTEPTHWEGEVLAVGPGKLTESGIRAYPSVMVGSVVAWHKHTGSEIEVAGERYDLVSESALLATIHAPAK